MRKKQIITEPTINQPPLPPPTITPEESDDEMSLPAPTPYPILSSATYQTWVEQLAGEIVQHELTSYVDQPFWVDVLHHQANTWEAYKNPTYDVNLQFEGVNKTKRQEAQRKKDIATRIQKALVDSLTEEDLKTIKNDKSAALPIKSTNNLTFQHFFSFAQDHYRATTFQSKQDILQQFITTGFPLPTSTNLPNIRK